MRPNFRRPVRAWRLAGAAWLAGMTFGVGGALAASCDGIVPTSMTATELRRVAADSLRTQFDSCAFVLAWQGPAAAPSDLSLLAAARERIVAKAYLSTRRAADLAAYRTQYPEGAYRADLEAFAERVRPRPAPPRLIVASRPRSVALRRPAAIVAAPVPAVFGLMAMPYRERQEPTWR